MSWWKKLPCKFGKHVWAYGENIYSDGRVEAVRWCRYCDRTEMTWKNYS